MFNENDYFDEDVIYILKSVNFNFHSDYEANSNQEIICTDTFSVDNTEEAAALTMARRLQFENGGPFELEVSYLSILSWLDNMDDDEMKRIIQEMIEEESPVIFNLCNRVSAMISDITMKFGVNPIITPPCVLREENS